jgi:phosphoribosylformylglycinamidine synthase
MPARLEITKQPGLRDAHGEGVRKKALDYFGIACGPVRTVQILTLDAPLDKAALETVRTEIFTNPVTQISSYSPLPVPFDWCVWVGLRPGVRDNPGATAAEAVTDVLGFRFEKDHAVYTSARYCFEGANLSREDMERVARELLANDIIQQWRVFHKDEWDPAKGIGLIIPKVRINRAPSVTVVPVPTDGDLLRVSRERGLELNPNDIPAIRAYFLREDVLEARKAVGLEAPTDVELEYISQARSDHCNHNTFRGVFHYKEPAAGVAQTITSLFKTCIEEPTLAVQRQKPWVVSVLWDNAGVARFDDSHYYTITGETHNSPSNMEAYGGSLTGIVGVYRDPMGTGLGSRLIAGAYGFCVGHRDYAGDLTPRLHPRRLLDGVVEGVKDGGNKSGIPTPHGLLWFDPGYMGKCLVFVTALGLMPATVAGKPSELKSAAPGDLIVMCGGRVGKDGIHGVTASSAIFSESTPAGHVQIGDPYTQKKMHDFLLEARDQGLITYITDNGGGGLSSSVGESARTSGGAFVELDKAPLKYEGLDQWEIWVSESQERMTVGIRPESLAVFMALAQKHAVEATVIGRYTDSGKLHITHEGKTCAYIDLAFLESEFPRWEFDCEWRTPQERGLFEPVLGEPRDYGALLLAMLDRPNIASREWIGRQYDHEVQGASVIKPFVGVKRDVPGDAGVLRPVLTSDRGVAVAQAIAPALSRIDAGLMAAVVVDEALRRVTAVGADPDETGGVDNFCWPSIRYDPVSNPDGRHKAAQLVRACLALKDSCLALGLPLLSGKDSMYVDGRLPGRFGETHKVSAPETLMFTASGIVPDTRLCQTPDPKFAGDALYVLGLTKDEPGGSEYYEMLGYTGANAPVADPAATLALCRALHSAVCQGLPASVHGVYRGGLGVHLALTVLAGNLGLDVDLGRVPGAERLPAWKTLYSESAGRFLVTVDPARETAFLNLFRGLPLARLGTVSEAPRLKVSKGGDVLLDTDADTLRAAWKKRFGGLV